MSEQLKILLLEDCPADAEMIQHFLHKNNFTFKIKVVYKRNDFIKALKNFLPDLILSDHKLPQFDSFDALKILKDKNLLIPFILVTGTVSEEFVVTIIKEGADDYILKNNLSRLPNAIQSAMEKRRVEIEKESYQKQLESKIQEINNFIYRISHDLKAPLASTFGLIAIARKETSDKNTLNYFDMIEHTNQKMEYILLRFSEIVRISQDNFIKQKILLRHIAEEIIRNLKNIPDAEGIAFKVKFDKRIEYRCSRELLNSILQNLIYNAIKYRRPIAESFIRIAIQKVKKKIVFKISDNGIGIPKELQPRIFEMFFRATISSTGSGLGLYIVKNAVEKLGGSISFKSTPGKGTAFKVTLPLVS